LATRVMRVQAQRLCVCGQPVKFKQWVDGNWVHTGTLGEVLSAWWLLPIALGIKPAHRVRPYDSDRITIT
jgi:hypothetical protein